MQSRTRVNPDATRLIRLLRPYTTHLRAFHQLLEEQGLVTATATSNGTGKTPSTPSPFLARTKKAKSQRTYQKKRRVGDLVGEANPRRDQAGEMDVFGDSSRTDSGDSKKQNKLPRKADGTILDDLNFPPLDCGQLDMKQLQIRSKAVVQSFRNICLVLMPPPTATFKRNLPTREEESTGASSLSHLAAVIIGRNLEEWLDAEMEVDDDHADDADGEEQGDRARSKIEEDKLDKLRECLEWIPMSGICQVFLDHCLTLALRLPNHPSSIHVLWPILQICKDLSQHHAITRVVPALVHSPDSITEGYFNHLISAVTAETPFVRDRLCDAVLSSLDKLTNKAYELLPRLISMNGQPRPDVGALFLRELWMRLEEDQDDRMREEVMSNQLLALTSLMLGASTSNGWPSAWFTVKQYVESKTVKGQLRYRKASGQPLLYLWAIALLAWTPPSEANHSRQRKLTSILSGLRTDPGIPFHLLDMDDITALHDGLKTASCPHVESWVLLHAIESGVQGLDDRLVQAERRIVELEMRQSKTEPTPWKPALKKRPRAGWTWDDVIEAWVEKTPVKEVTVPKRARLQPILPENGVSKNKVSIQTPERRISSPLVAVRINAANVPRFGSPLAALLGGKTFAKRPSTLAVTPIKLTPGTRTQFTSPLPIAPDSDDPLGDLCGSDSPFALYSNRTLLPSRPSAVQSPLQRSSRPQRDSHRLSSIRW